MRKVMLISAVLVLMCSAASAALAEEQAPGSEPTPSEAMPAEAVPVEELAPVEEAAPNKDGQGANEEESSAAPAAPDLDAGIGVDPVSAPDDNADVPKDEQS